jgi:hypothetical protein
MSQKINLEMLEKICGKMWEKCGEKWGFILGHQKNDQIS